MEKEEEWKRVNISGFSDYYMVSTMGRVYSIQRKIIMRQKNDGGYRAVGLSLGSDKKRTIKVHKLVALTFIPLSEGRDKINHKDGHKDNNNVDNLEWTTQKENAQHAIDVLGVPRKGICVIQYDKLGNILGKFASIKDAASAVGSKADSFNSLPKRFTWKKEQEVVLDPEPEGIQLEEYMGYIITCDGKVFSRKTDKYLVLKVCPLGYYKVNISQGGNATDISVHTLVALAYLGPCPTPEKREVNHKDRNKLNNNIENLEWVTRSENMIHAIATDDSYVHRRSVIQYTLDGTKLNTFNSIKEAGEALNISAKGISSACRGVQKTSGGYVWRYND